MLSNKKQFNARVNELKNQQRLVKEAQETYNNNKTSENYDKLLIERERMEKLHNSSSPSKTKVKFTQEELKEVMERFENEIHISFEEREFGLMPFGDYYDL